MAEELDEILPREIVEVSNEPDSEYIGLPKVSMGTCTVPRGLPPPLLLNFNCPTTVITLGFTTTSALSPEDGTGSDGGFAE